MKEQRFFYCPDIACGQLPEDEARHALRVLRLGEGDELWLMDGVGRFHQAVITVATGHRCFFQIQDTITPEREWDGTIHLAMAPTKNMDRTEWLAEKATEIGIDRLTFLDCQFSERHVVKSERIDKILIAAMKQSHKAWKPALDEMTAFRRFVTRPDLPPFRFIAHCYDMADVGGGDKPFLLEALTDMLQTTPAQHTSAYPEMLVLVGPEGDFSIDEVKRAHEAGFRSVSLGKSRLRTETAALAAVHLMHLIRKN